MVMISFKERKGGTVMNVLFGLFLLIAPNLEKYFSHDLPKEKKALVIGIDGLRPDSMIYAKTPNIDFLIEHGSVSFNAYAGGEIGTKTEQVTSSGPGWSSILTAVWTDKHGVTDNSFKNNNYKEYPHFFKRIKEFNPNLQLVSFVQWTPIHTHILSDADEFGNGSDEYVSEMGAKSIKAGKSDVVFLHFDDVDHAGHAYNYGNDYPKYIDSIEKTDRLIGLVLDEIRKKEKEDWLIVVTTDHGGINYGHGGQSIDERTIFFISSGAGMPVKTFEKGPGMTAVAPTVFRHLNITIKPEWGWDSKPFPSLKKGENNE